MATQNVVKQTNIPSTRLFLAQFLRYVEIIIPYLTPLLAAGLIYYLYDYGTDVLSIRENRADLKLFTFGLMWIALTSSWNLIGGYTGYIDFGHTLFVGLGSYAVANMMWSHAYEELAMNYSMSFWHSLPVAFAVGALFAGIMGWPTLRLKGPYFAIAMLGLFVAVREMSNTLPDLTRGGQGISFRRPFADPMDVYYTMLALAGGIFFVSLWIYRTQLGKMLQSIREDEVGAEMRGINTTGVKIGIFMLAGGCTAMVGATRAWWQGYIDPSTVYVEDYTIQIIMMAMLGGMGRPWGPVIGAGLFYYAQTTIWAELGDLNLIIMGSFLIMLVLFVPGGMLSLVDPEDRGLSWYLQRLRLYLLGESAEPIAIDSERTHEQRYVSIGIYSVLLLVGSVIFRWKIAALAKIVPNFFFGLSIGETAVILLILYIVYHILREIEAIVDFVPTEIKDFVARYEFDILVSLALYPLIFLIATYTLWHWNAFIVAIMPDFLWSMSGGETFFVFLMMYLLWSTISTIYAMTPYSNQFKEFVHILKKTLQATVTSARQGFGGILKFGLLILETVLNLVIDSDLPKEITPGEVLLEGRGVTKDFGGLRAVNGVNFNVKAGEIVGLLGPNGSGKTTLFNCISGVLPITDGSVYLAEQLISKKAPWRVNRRGLARTFQKIRVYNNLSVYENMLLARKWAGVSTFLWFWIAPPHVRQRADELLNFLLLDRVRHNLARNLSGGQQRLLEIGMSLMSNPYIVLLDEATSGVNPVLIEEIKSTIQRLNKEQGVTFLLIEHNMNFIMDLCERLYVLDYGTKIAEGSPLDIQNNQQVIEAYFGHD